MKNNRPALLHFFMRILLASVTGLFFLCSSLNNPYKSNSYYLDSLQKLSFSKYLDQPVGYDSVIHSPNWDAYTFSALQYSCVMGGPFGLLVHHGKEKHKTVLWMQAGQECWPDHPNCGGSATYSIQEAMAYEASGLDGGPFGPTNADLKNPIADWNYIYVPSCDGSFHFGDAEADYDNDGKVDHYHHGLRQTSAAVNLMEELFPETKEVLIFGSSTGGFGTFGAAPIVRLAFPQTFLTVFNDSGPGIFSAKTPAIWPEIIKTWNISPMLPEDCPQCSQQLIYFYDWMLERDSNLNIGLFSSHQDAVVANVVGMSEDEYEKTLVELTNYVHQAHPETFKRYFIHGNSHTLGDFYRKENGITLWNWLTQLVNKSPQWSDLMQ